MLKSILRNHSQFQSPKNIQDGKKRACVAMIFRINNHAKQFTRKVKFQSRDDLLEFLETFDYSRKESFSTSVEDQNRDTSTCELLFIKRAFNPKDKWSGHVAFPGGRVQKDDPDFLSCAIREVQEEIGIELNKKENFLYIGRLDDQIASRPKPLLRFPSLAIGYWNKVNKKDRDKRVFREVTKKESADHSLIISTFLFVQIDYSKELDFVLAPKEVQSVFWVPTTTIATSIPDNRESLKMSLKELKLNSLMTFLMRLFGCRHFHFPSIPLNPTKRIFSSSIDKDLLTGSNDEINNYEYKKESNRRKDSSLPLWGLSLRLVDDLRKKIKENKGQDKIDCRGFKSNSKINQKTVFKTQAINGRKLPFYSDSPIINFVISLLF